MSSTKMWYGALALALAFTFTLPAPVHAGGQSSQNGKRYTRISQNNTNNSRTNVRQQATACSRAALSNNPKASGNSTAAAPAATNGTYTANYSANTAQGISPAQVSGTVCIPRSNLRAAAAYASTNVAPPLAAGSERVVGIVPRRYFTGRYVDVGGVGPGPALAGYDTWNGSTFAAPALGGTIRGVTIGAGPTGRVGAPVTPPPGRMWNVPASVINQGYSGTSAPVVEGVEPLQTGFGAPSGGYFTGAYSTNTNPLLPRTEYMGMTFSDRTGTVNERFNTLGSRTGRYRDVGPMSTSTYATGDIRDFY